MPTYNPGTGFFSDSQLLPVWPQDPDAPRLLATGRYAMVDTQQPEVAAILAGLQSQGNPTTAAGVYAQAAQSGSVPQSWIGSVAEAAAQASAASMVAYPAYDFATGATAVGPGVGFNPQNIAQGLAQLHSVAMQIYGSIELGHWRQSSAALENGASGIRPGSMERIVVPAWAARERGFPS